MRVFSKFALSALLAFALAACGSSGSSTSSDTGSSGSASETKETANYTFEFTPVTAQAEGRSVFTIGVTHKHAAARAAGESGQAQHAVSGADIGLSVWMSMSSGMSHSTPVVRDASNGDGTYTCVVYYLMASSMNGVSMGTWSVDVTVNGETATFNPDVMMAMGGTARVTFKNAGDMIAGSMGAETRSYYLFNESLMGSTGNHMFKVFLATRESMMNHPAVYTGQDLHDAGGEHWTAAVTLQASTNGTDWADMTENGSGYFTASGLSGLTDGHEGAVYVRLFMNGVQYTTDGSPASGENAYQTFTVTPGSSMTM